MKFIIRILKKTFVSILILIFLTGMVPVAVFTLFFLSEHKDYPRVNKAFNSLEGLVLDMYRWARK